jgi:hypothetical protein
VTENSIELGRISEELERLRERAPQKAQADLVGPIKIRALTRNGDTSDALQRIKTVLTTICELVLKQSLNLKSAEGELPLWFKTACSNEPDWDLESWLSWFEIGERMWFWWTGYTEDHGKLAIELVSDGFPFAWGSLDWLMTSAGCKEIKLESPLRPLDR